MQTIFKMIAYHFNYYYYDTAFLKEKNNYHEGIVTIRQYGFRCLKPKNKNKCRNIMQLGDQFQKIYYEKDCKKLNQF